MKKIMATVLSVCMLSAPITSFAAFYADEKVDGFEYAYPIEYTKDMTTTSEWSNKIERNRNTQYYEDEEGYTYKVFVKEGIGHYDSVFFKAVNGGRCIFDIKLPQEKVSEISSDGNIKVFIQRYEQYQKNKKEDDVLKLSSTGGLSHPYVNVVMKGDIGEKEYEIKMPYCFDVKGDNEVIDGKYYYRLICMPVIHHDDDVIVSQSYAKVGIEGGGYETDESGNSVYADICENKRRSNGDIILGVYSEYHKVEDYMQIVYEMDNDKYYGIKSIGIGFSDGSIFTIPQEEAIIDFEFETSISDNKNVKKRKANVVNNVVKNYYYVSLVDDYITELRDERLVNNETSNVLTAEYVEDWLYGDDEPDTDISDKPIEEPVEEPDEQPGELPEDDNPELPPEDVADKTDETEDIKVSLDDKELDFDSQQPLIENDRVLVPMRKIFEELGAEIEWDEETQTVTATIGDTVITLQIGKNEITKNGVTTEIDTETQLVNDRTLVPLRAVSESFGNTVTWNAETKTVEITK